MPGSNQNFIIVETTIFEKLELLKGVDSKAFENAKPQRQVSARRTFKRYAVLKMEQQHGTLSAMFKLFKGSSELHYGYLLEHVLNGDGVDKMRAIAILKNGNGAFSRFTEQFDEVDRLRQVWTVKQMQKAFERAVGISKPRNEESKAVEIARILQSGFFRKEQITPDIEKLANVGFQILEARKLKRIAAKKRTERALAAYDEADEQE